MYVKNMQNDVLGLNKRASHEYLHPFIPLRQGNPSRQALLHRDVPDAFSAQNIHV